MHVGRTGTSQDPANNFCDKYTLYSVGISFSNVAVDLSISFSRVLQNGSAENLPLALEWYDTTDILLID